MAWLCYLVAIILWNAVGWYDWAMIAFAVGMVFHWKYWLAGFAAFFVGISWKSLFE